MLRYVLIVLLKKNGFSFLDRGLLILISVLFGGCVSEKSLTSNERIELESYFRTLFTKSEFAFTLFGDKPMSFYDYVDKPPIGFLIHTSLIDPKIETQSSSRKI